MLENCQLVHGSDFVDYRYYPKFLGLCLKRLDSLAKLTIAQFMEKLKVSKSFSTVNELTHRKIKEI